jgi:hypothetical protein
MGAQGLHAISLPTGYIGLFAAVQFISSWLVIVTGEVGVVCQYGTEQGGWC